MMDRKSIEEAVSNAISSALTRLGTHNVAIAAGGNSSTKTTKADNSDEEETFQMPKNKKRYMLYYTLYINF